MRKHNLIFSNQFTVGVLIGSSSDQKILEKSGLANLLKKFCIDFEVSIISSDRNPEKLRKYCLDNNERLSLIIALAGGVPNLPIVAKSWLPHIPVISVPIEENPDFVLAAITTPKDIPIIVAGYGIKGIQKAAYITRDIIGLWKKMDNTKKIKFRAVLFDFDYTLADTSRGAMESINFALNSLHLPLASYDAICQTIGMSLAETYHTLSGDKQSLQTDKFIHLFKERADKVMEKLSVLYDSVPSVVKNLKKNRLLLGVVSTKFHYRIEAILKRNKLLDKFDIIIGGDDVSKQKPDPEGLRLAINTLNIPSSNVLYIGDSTIDAITAEKANVPFAAVLSGVTKRNEFDKYTTYGVYKDLYHLLDWLL